MSQSRRCAQSTADIINIFSTVALPIANGTYAIGGAVASKAIIETFPWAVIVSSSLNIIRGILRLIDSPPPAIKKLYFIDIASNGVILGAGVQAA